MKKQIFAAIILICSACTKQAPRELSLQPTGEFISIQLDAKQVNSTDCFRHYEFGDTEYLCLLNRHRNGIDFFNLTNDTKFNVNFEKSGPDGIGLISGFSLKNEDTIYVTPSDRMCVFMMDKNGKKLNTFPFSELADKQPTSFYRAWSFPDMPILFGDNYITVCQEPLYSGRKTPPDKFVQNILEIKIDLESKKVEPLFHYPKLYTNRQSFPDPTFSRIFTGGKYIYNFFKSPDLYVYHNDSCLKYPAFSNKKGNDFSYAQTNSIREQVTDMVRNPFYFNLVYDPYRQVYYRFFYPGFEINSELEEYRVYFKGFHVIVLDKEFSPVGETIFPTDFYDPRYVFVNKSGLYISTGHFKNPGFSADQMSFQKFGLLKN